jgi:hypothetical protein
MSGEQPVQRGLGWDLSGCPFYGSDATYTVPTGKWLRIDQVTFRQKSQLHNVNQDYIIEFSVLTFTGAGPGARHYLEHTVQGVSQLVELYAAPGTLVRFTAVMESPGCAFFEGSFSGVLVDAS